MENRLRDAYREAAQTIAPQTVRRLNEQTIQISTASSRWERRRSRKVMIPLAAAASVAIAVVLATVVVPRALSASRPTSGHHRQNHVISAAGSPASRFAIAISSTASNTSLAVHSVPTGAVVAHIRAPHPGMYFASIATGDGRTYVAVLWRSGVCRSWLYQFTLNRNGRPSTLVPYALRSIREVLGPIAISKDNGTFAYLGENCSNRADATSSDLAAMDVATKRTRQWTISSQANVSSLSLTATGNMLAYNIALTQLFRSAALVLPTNAPPGTAAERSRVVVRAAQFGRTDEINSDVIAPDGTELYFTTNRVSSPSAAIWQLRVASLATGRSRILQAVAGLPYPFAANPSVTKLLILIQPTTVPVPSPSPTPSGRRTVSPSPTPTGRRTPSPSPTPTGHRTPSPTPTPTGRRTPSPSPTPTRVRTVTPTPTPTGRRTATPSPTPSPPGSVQFAMIDLRTGTVTFLDTSTWQISLDSSFAW
jgi:hypothetical protein